MMNADMKIVNHVLHEGQGVPVVLVHAFPIDHRMWLECARSLILQANEQGISPLTIYAPDTPGAGESPVPTPQESGGMDSDGAFPAALDRMADAYADLLTSLGHEKAIWVGLSMGGYLVAAIQRLHPQLVAGLAFCDTTVLADTAENRSKRLHIADECEITGNLSGVMHFAQAGPEDSTIKQTAEFSELFTEWIRSQNPKGIAWRQRMAAGRPDQTSILPAIDVPVAVVSGELDPSSPPELMQTLVDGLKSTKPSFTTISNCGHFSAVEHPEVVASALLQLITEVNKHISAN